jgi:hypothetical protein
MRAISATAPNNNEGLVFSYGQVERGLRAAIAAMGTIASDGGEVDVERLWSALAGHQSDDRTWLQIGKSDFVRAIAAINSQQREGNGE